jgi:hypothetical protein
LDDIPEFVSWVLVGDGGGARYNEFGSSSSSGWVDEGSEVAIDSFGCVELLVNIGSIVLEIKVKTICPV